MPSTVLESARVSERASTVTSTAIDVVAGIIFNETRTRVLLTLRKPDQHQGNCWEFPGGKMESSESQEQALSRELNEELGIEVVESEPFCQLEHDYGDKVVRLFFWQVGRFNNSPTGREAQIFEWFAIEDLAGLNFPDANKPVVDQLVQAD